MMHKDILQAQENWANALIEIGKLIDNREACEGYTKQAIEELYAFEKGTILFKPTKASIRPFRTDREGALSYFIGGNENFPEDAGFALQPWESIRFENEEIIQEENRALAMGHYYFTDHTGQETKVEYSFGYWKNDKNELKIDLHHSSLPFSISTKK
jgi:hypothetical protein